MQKAQKRADSVRTFSAGEHREPGGGSRYAGHGPSYSELSNGEILPNLKLVDIILQMDTS
jgi:hypothetical protein